jgi:DNA-binding transcriptional LysR family regulator
MNYTLHQLRIFQKVAETLSITKAAEALYLTQPAVSIQLKNFLSQFEIPLLEVVQKRIYLTEFGREIALAADKILSEVDAIQVRMHSYQGRLSGRLKLSAVSTGKYIAPYFAADFMKGHPEVELSMDVTNKTQVITSLERNEVDFSLVSVLPSHLRIEKAPLMLNKLFLVGKADHPFQEARYDKRIFEQIPLIYREDGSGTRHVMEQFIRKNNISVHLKMELTSNEAVKQAVLAGLGYSIMPLIGIKNELLQQQLRIIPVKGFPIVSTWYLIWLKDKQLSPVAKAYRDFILAEKDRIMKEQFEWYETY